VYDDNPADYPRGYNHDISLIKPLATVNIENIKSPNLRWITKDEWKSLQKGQVLMEILGEEAKSIKNSNEQSCSVCIVVLSY